MAAEAAAELLFLETFKHQNSEKGTNVDVVRFPYVVYISEVRVIPPGVRAHTSLPENRAYGETSPHTFQLDLFFNNVSKPSTTVFDRLGSLDYDENNSIIFRPNSKVNTDGLVLKGWYNSLTLAIYGSVDRVVKHERESPPPPPPPPPPQQTQNALKRAPKNASQTSVPDEAGRPSGATATMPPSTFQKPAIKAEAVKEEPYSGSPPRPQPRGPRTPPGPPPPDDDEEEPIPVEVPPTVVGEKQEEADLREDFFEPISPDRASGQQEGPFSDQGDAIDDPPEEGDEEEDDVDVDDDEDEEDEDEEEEDDDGNTVESIPEDEDDEGEEEEGEGDDGYEQISSDEDGIADLERESFKYPSFDIDYTVEDLAAVPAMSYDPYDRELGPMLYFNCPYKTAFENEMCRMREDTEKENVMATELSLKLAELLESYQEDRSSKWVDILEEVPGLIVKGLSYLQLKEPNKDYLTQLVDWAMQALSVHAALGPPVALSVRQLKAGTKLVSSLVECGNQGVLTLLNAGIIDKLFELLFTEHVSSSVKLYLLKALDSVISMTKGMEVFLKSRLENNEKSGYQKLLELILFDQTVRVVSAGSAILQKCHFYEILSEIKKLGDKLADSTPPITGHGVIEQDSNSGIGKASRDYDTEVETPMDMDQLMESSLIGEGDVEKLVSFLDEILHLLEIAPYTMIQPPVKSFPTSARITGPPERDDPYPVLYRYLHSQHFQESVTLLLSIPAVNTHPGVLQATRDILRFLAQSQKGLLFLLAEHEGTNLLARALCQASDQDQEEALQTDVVSEDSFALWLLHATQTLQYTSELFQYFQEGAASEETDNADLLGILHSLYLISFNPIGRSAVAHVFSLDKNLQSLITLMEFYSKDALGDAKSKKLVAYNYACMLVLLVVQSSSDVQMLEHHAAPLLKLCKSDENNTKLQELGKWLEPLRNLRFEMGCIASLTEYIKQNIDNVMAPEGVGLLTALRALCHVACPPPPVEGQQKDLKWNLAIIQLFSADGLDTFIRILQKLNTVLIQPWRLHVNMGTTLHRVTTISVARCTLTLLKTMLTELLKGGAFEFKDTRIPSSLVALHMLLCSIPISGRLDGEEQKIQNDIVDILLTFTQGVNEQVTMSEETLANNTWSLMLKEVLSFVLKIPEGFFSGLVLLSELLPFPLPLQTTEPIERKDIAVALNTRKLWSVHLHVQAKLLQDIVRSFSGSSCQPLQHMVRRICIQLCDLASPTALLIMRTVLDLIIEDLQSNTPNNILVDPNGKEICGRFSTPHNLKSGNEVKPRPYTGQTARLLGLLDALASHRACKVVILYLINATSKGDERYTELFLDLLTLIKTAGNNIIHLQCADYVASILQCLCDQDIALILPSSQDGPISEPEQLSNSLPSKELMPFICDTLMETVSNKDSSFASLLTCIRTMMFLSEHDFGFYYIKSSMRKHNDALHNLLKRVVRSFSKDSGELASSFLDFMRQILSSDTMVCTTEENSVMEVDGTHTSKTFGLTTAEVKQLLQRKDETPANLLQDLEKHVMEHSKEDDTLESLLDNVVGFRQMLESAGNPTPLSDQDVEPVLSPPEFLSNLFNNRTVYVLADVMDDQLKSLSFSPFQADEIDTDLDMVKVDLIELSGKCCDGFDLRAELERSFMLEPTSPGRAKTNKGFKLGKHKHETFITSGKSEYIEPAKRAHMGLPPRGRGRGGFGQGPRHNDLFRQRKQNTSRPPSMHVDDFVAAECKDVPSPIGLPMAKRLPKIAPKTISRGGFLGNRGGRGAFHSQNRFFSPPAPKEPENKGRMLMEYLCNQGMRPLNGRTPGDPLGGPGFYKGNYNRREGVRGLSWSAQNTPRGNYSENRGGQSNFNRGPPPQLRQNSAGYRPNPRDRASRGRGGLGPSWGNANNGGGGNNNNSRGKFLGGNGGRGRHARAFTR